LPHLFSFDQRGPVGLAAAVFDRALLPSPYSRALAVNPRTLQLLESAGLTSHLLELGLRINEVQFGEGDKQIARISLAKIQHKYPFMLALSQATTERVFAEKFELLGGRVERGKNLVNLE
jgi:2-polyprenyl-6-methoxyphenol hydroxylase-like FAD-dependent oxidoreductase